MAALEKVNLSLVPAAFDKKEDGEASIWSETPDALPMQYGLLEEAMIQAGDDHIVTPLPVSKPESTSEYSTSRYKTIRNRLYMLGYLDHDDDRAGLDKRLRQGIENFQKDAFGTVRLTADGWVGDQTWGALQELVSFEEPSNLQKWFSDGEPCPALRRAVHLRMFALGLAYTKPTIKEAPAERELALSRFCNMAGSNLLHLVDEPLTDSLNIKTLELLFDQDELVGRLARATIPKGRKNLLEIKPFIISMTKVELWLMGYDVVPDGYGDDAPKVAVGKELDLVKHTGLKKELINYWKDLGPDGKLYLRNSSPQLKAMLLVKSSFPVFFLSVHERLELEDKDASADSEIVFKQLESQMKKDNNLLQKVWNHIHSIGARIWDGIKRAWHWLKSRMKSFMSSVEAILKNLSRLAYNYIRKVYEAVRAVIKGVTGSISFFIPRVLNIPKSKLNLSGPTNMVIGRDKDFDFRVLVDVQDKAGDIEIIAEYINDKSKLFAVSCHFLSSMLQILLDLLKKSWLAGWSALLMALLKLYKSIAHWAPEFLEAQRKEDAFVGA